MANVSMSAGSLSYPVRRSVVQQGSKQVTLGDTVKTRRDVGRDRGSRLLEQQEEWQLQRRRFFSEATMAKIPELEEMLEFTESDSAIS
jgi:hypothetical protein